MAELDDLALEYSQLQQQLQNSYIQKENSRVELNEITSALDELKNVKGDVFRHSGVIVIKADPKTIAKDLEEKKELLELRLKSFDKKDMQLKERFQIVQQELMSIKKD